jgi:phosphoglycolate phosphatase
MKAVLFDLDGTLIDSGADIASAANTALRTLGRPELREAVIRSYVGDGVANLMRRCVGGDDPVPDEAVAWFQVAYQKCALDRTVLYPGIRELLADLDRTPLAVVSNKPEAFCHRILEGLGVARHFRLIAGGETFPEKKPSPAPYLTILDRFGVSRNEALVVGDGPQDVRAARAAGIRSCAVLWGFTPREKLAAEGPDLLVASVAELRIQLGFA